MRLRDKVRRGEEGFTLVELLMVLAVLAILVAIVMANFTGLLSSSKEKANEAELNIVQTAVDVKWANTPGMSTWAPVILEAAATNDMTNAAGGFDLYPSYMRGDTSSCFYWVSAEGTVSQLATCTPP